MKPRYFYTLPIIAFMCFQSANTVSANNAITPMTCEERLKLLEPSEPKTIYDYDLMPDRDISKFKEKVLPNSEVQKKGSNIPFYTIYKDLSWQRPAYARDWHSSYWRWSYAPIHMADQQHRVFGYSGGLSVWYDLSNYLALPPKAGGPSPIHESAFTIKYPYVIRLIIFNFDIKSMKHYENQIVVTGEPLRKGFTMIDFDTKDLPGTKKLLQLATPDGYEIDYLILYVGKSNTNEGN